MVDFKILLFHSNAADISKFHMRNFDIDLVIQSKVHKLASDGGKNKTPVFSCGSGVTACVLALAYSLINNKYMPVIYDGSWAEYGRS